MIALLLGFIEGLTEFLPVSSTGHLILAGELVGFTDNSSVAFKIAIQLGAILAVLLVYWRRFWAVGTGLLKRQAGPIAFTRNILLGFAPALVIGVVAYDAIRAAMQTPRDCRHRADRRRHHHIVVGARGEDGPLSIRLRKSPLARLWRLALSSAPRCCRA